MRDQENKRAWARAYYHRTKHLRGIKSHPATTASEKREAKREWDRAYHHANREEQNARMRQYRKDNYAKVIAAERANRHVHCLAKRARANAWRLANPEASKLRKKAHYEANRERIIAKIEAYRQANMSKVLAGQKKYREANKEKSAANAKAWRAANSEACKERSRKYRIDNPGKLSAYLKARKQIDPEFRLRCQLRAHVWRAIKCGGGKKSAPIALLVGCSIAELITYLESKFLAGMSWKERSKFDIDHIKPCAAYDLTERAEQLACFHFSNLQPLWKKDNQRKSSTFNGVHFRRKKPTSDAV